MCINAYLESFINKEVVVEKPKATNDYIYDAIEDDVDYKKPDDEYSIEQMVNRYTEHEMKILCAIANGAEFALYDADYNEDMWHTVGSVMGYGCLNIRLEHLPANCTIYPDDDGFYKRTDEFDTMMKLFDEGIYVEDLAVDGIMEYDECELLLSKSGLDNFIKKYNEAVKSWNAIIDSAQEQYEAFRKYGCDTAIEKLKAEGKPWKYVAEF